MFLLLKGMKKIWNVMVANVHSRYSHDIFCIHWVVCKQRISTLKIEHLNSHGNEGYEPDMVNDIILEEYLMIGKEMLAKGLDSVPYN